MSVSKYFLERLVATREDLKEALDLVEKRIMVVKLGERAPVDYWHDNEDGGYRFMCSNAEPNSTKCRSGTYTSIFVRGIENIPLENETAGWCEKCQKTYSHGTEETL